jgi:hypothetical protein
MSRQPDNAATATITVIRGHRPPDSERELAYQAWAWECEESCAAVAARFDLEPRTIQRWCRDDRWRMRKVDELAEVTPKESRYLAAVTLVDTAPRASLVLREMIDGTRQPNRDLMAICNSVLDRAGLGPIPNKDVNVATRPEERQDDGPASSPEEAQARIAARRERFKSTA